jgi:ATP phosphoribosyltransferase regulatory subunit
MNSVNSMLPSGFYDSLTPDAAREAHALETLLGHFAAWGYARVAPPLMEFEETLLSGPGSVLNRTTFRVMDAVSHRMLGLRTDHTLQIGRLAATRLANAPRPLRLSYAGPVLRAVASERDPARQKMQIGFELIGSLTPEADAEAIRLGITSLAALGVTDISIDLLLPTLVPSILEAAKVDDETRTAIQHALDRKDAADLEKATKGLSVAADLALLLRSSGDADTAMKALKGLSLPEKAVADRARLEATLALLGDMKKMVTIDLVEGRHFEYQTGLSFSFFSRKGQVELGRGGRYRTSQDEPATGLTFYSEAFMQVLPAAKTKPHMLIPFTLAAADAAKLQADGYVLVSALEKADAAAAKKQGCSHMWENGKAVAV